MVSDILVKVNDVILSLLRKPVNLLNIKLRARNISVLRKAHVFFSTSKLMIIDEIVGQLEVFMAMLSKLWNLSNCAQLLVFRP